MDPHDDEKQEQEQEQENETEQQEHEQQEEQEVDPWEMFGAASPIDITSPPPCSPYPSCPLTNHKSASPDSASASSSSHDENDTAASRRRRRRRRIRMELEPELIRELAALPFATPVAQRKVGVAVVMVIAAKAAPAATNANTNAAAGAAANANAHRTTCRMTVDESQTLAWVRRLQTHRGLVHAQPISSSSSFSSSSSSFSAADTWDALLIEYITQLPEIESNDDGQGEYFENEDESENEYESKQEKEKENKTRIQQKIRKGEEMLEEEEEDWLSMMLEFLHENVCNNDKVHHHHHHHHHTHVQVHNRLLKLHRSIRVGGAILMIEHLHSRSRNRDRLEKEVDKKNGGVEWLDASFLLTREASYGWTRSMTIKSSTIITRLHKSLGRIQTDTTPWLSTRSAHAHANNAAWALERQRVASATVPLSWIETTQTTSPSSSSSSLSARSRDLAVQALTQYGYCILPGLLSADHCQALGQAIVHDWHDAAARITRTVCHLKKDPDQKDKDSSDQKEAEEEEDRDYGNIWTTGGAYREVSFREAYRVDLRQGPRLHQVRQEPAHCYHYHSENDTSTNKSITGNSTWTIRHDTDFQVDASESSSSSSNSGILSTPFFRGHSSMLDIVRRCMNGDGYDNDNNNSNVKTGDNFGTALRSSLKRNAVHVVNGNWGRYNFSGSPPGSYPDVRVSVLGGIVSLPGAADQALHADTPHLLEHLAVHLPPHYINAFAACIPAAPGVGQTAFVHASHRLDVASRLLSTPYYPHSSGVSSHPHPHQDPACNSSPPLWHAHLVRPVLEPGDVVLFDCRILHFGLANTNPTLERPILYLNMMQHWFSDPKNWQQQEATPMPLFPELFSESS